MHYENACSDTLSDLPVLYLADIAFIVKDESITSLTEREVMLLAGSSCQSIKQLSRNDSIDIEDISDCLRRLRVW